MIPFLRTALVALLLLVSTGAFAETVLQKGDELYQLAGEAEYLVDPEGKLTIEDVTSPEYAGKFLPHEKQRVNFGMSRDTVWFRITLKNRSGNSNWVMALDWPLTNLAVLYTPTQFGWKESLNGDINPLYKRELRENKPCFPVRFGDRNEMTVYLKAQDDATLRFGIALIPQDHFPTYLMKGYVFIGLASGVIIAMVLYTLFQLLLDRKRTSWEYLFFVLVFGVYLLTHQGLHLRMFPQDMNPWFVHNLPMLLAGVAYYATISYTQTFLEMRVHFPTLNRIYVFMKLYGISVSFITLFSYHYSNIVAYSIGYGVSFMLTYAGIHAWFRGMKKARYFVLAWFFFTFGGGVIFSMLGTGILPTNGFTLNSLMIGFLGQTVLLAFAQADGVNLERIQYQHQLELDVATSTSELRLAMSNLKRSEERFRSMIENTSDIIQLRDRHGKLLFSSDSVERITGYSVQELMGLETFDNRIHPSQRAELLETYANLVTRPGSSLHTEFQYQHKSGRWMTLEAVASNMLNNPSVNGIVIIARDITARKQAESDLRYLNSFITLVMNTSARFINVRREQMDKQVVRALGEVGSFARASRAYMASFIDNGRSISNTHEWCNDGVPSKQADFKHFYYWKKYRWIMREMIRQGAVYIADTHKLPPEAAPERELADSFNIRSLLLVPMMTEDRITGILGFEAVGKPVTWSNDIVDLLTIVGEIVGSAYERKIAEETVIRQNEELKKTLEQLKEVQQTVIMQEKMASLGAITAGIAHEIKNPLNFVNNFARMNLELAGELRGLIVSDAIAEPAQMEQAKALLDDITSNCERINMHGKRADGIIRTMLLHSRGRSGQASYEDINLLVEENLSLAYHGARARSSTFAATIQKRLANNLPLVKVVPQDVGRVLLNLCNNGFQATTEKSKKGIEGYVPTLTVTTAQTGNSIKITVRDNGAGIPHEIQDKIFAPFFTTKPEGKGTGLGLSICYEIIVQQHGGELSFQSVPGEYSEFTVLLPLDQSGQISSPVHS